MVSVVARRLRSRAVVELENLAIRHQLHVLRRQRPGRPRLLAIDRWLWIWPYRIWPRCLEAMVLVKPATVVSMASSGIPPVLALALEIRATVWGSVHRRLRIDVSETVRSRPWPTA
jgi:hypothetical protein